jgi:hypothetical protein
MKMKNAGLLLAGLVVALACNLGGPSRPPAGGTPSGTTPSAEAKPAETLAGLPSATARPSDTAADPPAVPGGFFPIAVGTSYKPNEAILLGGAENGAWLDTEAAAARLSGGETYTLYAPDGPVATAVGSKPERERICPQYYFNWSPAPSATALVGLGGGAWNALPRPPAAPVVADYPLYTTAAADWLASQGMPVPDPLRLAGVVRADLDGDGTMEAIISASRFSDGSMHDVGAGDFTFVLLYREAAAETILLAGKVYPDAKSMVFPMAFSLLTILDLNGDGRMEVIVHVSLWEGEGTRVFAYNGSAAEMVLSASCSA